MRELETTVGYPASVSDPLVASETNGNDGTNESEMSDFTNCNDDDDKENDVASIAVGKISEKFTTRDMMDVARDIVFSVGKIRDKEKKNMMFGALFKFAEFAKGNIESMESLTLEQAVNDHLSVLCRSTNGLPLFSQQTMMSQDNAGNDDGSISKQSSEVQDMRRGAPTVAGNQFSKKRKKSANERMIDAQKRKHCCSICLNEGHFSTGSKCPMPRKYNA